MRYREKYTKENLGATRVRDAAKPTQRGSARMFSIAVASDMIWLIIQARASVVLSLLSSSMAEHPAVNCKIQNL